MKYMTVDPNSSSNVGIFTIKNQQLVYNFTLEFWIKCKFNSTTTTDRSLFEVIQFDDVEKVNKTVIKIYVPKNSKNYKYAIDDTEVNVPNYKMDNMWNHVAMVFDTGTSCAIYLNGNNIAIKNMSLMPDIKLKALDEFRFYSYKSTSNCYVYIYNINITKAIRYNNLFKIDTIMTNTNYGLKLDLDNEMTTEVIKPEVSMSAEDPNNVIFLPFQQNTGIDEAKNHTMTVTGSTYLSLVNLTSEDYFYSYDKYYNLQIAASTSNSLNSITSSLTNTNLYDELTMEMFYKTSSKSTSNRDYTFTLGYIKKDTINKQTNETISSSDWFSLSLSPPYYADDLKLHHYSITYSNSEKRISVHKDGILTSNIILPLKEATNENNIFKYYLSDNLNFKFKLYAINDKACYVRFSNKALYPNRHFDPSILLFKPIIDKIKNGTDKIKSIDDEDIALLYPGITNQKYIYERAYTKNIDVKNSANFQVDNDSTSDIALDNTSYKTSYKYSGKKFLSYPAIVTKSNSNYRNMIIFRNHCPETKSWTLEFFVHMNATISTMEMIDVFFVSGISGNGCIGMQANGRGLVEIKYNATTNYSINILNQPEMTINSVDNMTNIDDWNHIALSCNVSSEKNTTLTFYINGQSVGIYDNTKVLISTLHRLFFFTHYTDYPFKLAFTGIKVTMRAKTEEELAVQ